MRVATERLRKLLDEYGIEHMDFGDVTKWKQIDNDYAIVYDELEDGSCTRLTVYDATPEQAISATFGERTCHNAWAMSDSDTDAAMFVCSECSTWVGKRVYWHPVDPSGEKYLVLDCDVKYCPNCGRKVVDE